MFFTKLYLHTYKKAQHELRRSFLSKIFGCGCFGKKGPELPPDLSKETRIASKGMCMPMIGLGTWQMKPEHVRTALLCAIDQGYRHIDTAFVYGNEQEIGKTLKTLFEQRKVSREELFISSKLPYFGMTPEGVKEYVNKSLCNLGLNYLDLYMIHFPVGFKSTDGGDSAADDHTNHLAIWKEMEAHVDSGKIRNLGLSNFNIRQVKNIMECAKYLPTNLQVEMHLYCQQKEIKTFCEQYCISLTAYAPLGSPGLPCYACELGLKPNPVPKPLENPSVLKIAAWHKKCPSQILLRHLIQLGGIAIIPKSSCPERIKKNIDLFDFSLIPCEMNEMNSMDLCEQGRMFGSNLWVGTKQHCEYPFGC